MIKRHAGALKGYTFGLACTFAGAWLAGVTDSMLPLALGAAALLLATAQLVRSIWSRGRKQDHST